MLLLKLLKDGKWHNTVQIMRKVYGIRGHVGICRIGARIHDLKDMGYEIESRPVNHDRTVWAYKLIR